MKSFMTRDGPILLLLLMLSACGTATTPSPSDVAFAQTQQALAVCGTAVALNMPNPCAPTSTPTPIPTATPMPSPTPIPFTGIKQFTEQGEWVRDMPLGFVPQCEGLVGCPGWMYIEYVNGVPVNGVPKGTPGYWPFILFGVPLALIAAGLLGFGIWNATASSREMARGIRAMMNVQIAELGNNQRALPAPDPQMVSTREFVGWITGFLREHPNQQLATYLRDALQPVSNRKMLPMAGAIELIRRFDETNGSNVVLLFTQYLHKVERSKHA